MSADAVAAVVWGIAVVTTGLVAGTVFAYANSVMPGLRRADDRTMVLAVRHLNAAVDNPVFLVVSNLALVAQIALVVLSAVGGAGRVVLAGTALAMYAATLAVTFAGNLPLNRAVISAAEPATAEGWAQLRAAFEARWTRLNLARVLTSVASVVLLLTVAVSA